MIIHILIDLLKGWIMNPKIDFSSFEHYLGIVEQLYEFFLSC
mgnify:CR=1 FL=1